MREFSLTQSFTRPADTTAYTAGDLVANSVTAGSVVPLTFVIPPQGVELDRIQVKFNSSTNTNGKFRAHLYSSSPTCANGDNGAWSTTASGYLGDVDVDCTVRAFTDASVGTSYINSADVPVQLGSGSLYVLLEATAAYTPTSAEVFTVILSGRANF